MIFTVSILPLSIGIGQKCDMPGDSDRLVMVIQQIYCKEYLRLERRQCAQYHTYSQGQIFILGGKTAVMNATDDDSWIIYPADFASVLGKCLLSIIVTNLLGMFQLIKTSL